MSALACFFIGLWIGAGVGFFFARVFAVGGPCCIALVLLMVSPAPAEALTKHECIHLGYGCQWSKATGGRVNGWYFAKARETRWNGHTQTRTIPATAFDHASNASDAASAVASRTGGHGALNATSRASTGSAQPLRKNSPDTNAEAELRSLFPERLPPGCPQALINQAFAVLEMGR